MSSPYSNFVYEISLYLNMPFLKLSSCLQRIVSFCTLYMIMFTNNFEKGLEKSMQKVA